MPDRAFEVMETPIFVFAHGAGAPSSHPWMRRWEGKLAAANELHVVGGGDHSLLVAKSQLKASGETQDEVDQRILP